MTLNCILAAKVKSARLEKSMETGITIPDFVIEEILLRLQVKHLLRWKCVSKHWYAVICDDDFVKKHYHFHYDMHLAVHGDVPLLLDTVPILLQPTKFHLVSKEGECYVANNITAEFERDTEHVLPRVPGSGGPRCAGLVNGVVCLEKVRNHVVLWNPATREIKDVPVCPIMMDYEEGKAYTNIVGFGFDIQSNDFKILSRISTWTDDDETKYTDECHMYSLMANSWKRVKDVLRTDIYLFPTTTDTYFNNGVYYWTAVEESGYKHPCGIISFNFSSEIFKESELPSGGETWNRCRVRIGKYKEGLALLVVRGLGTIETCFEIWAATKFRDDDNEIPSSWQLVVKAPPCRIFNLIKLGSMLNCGDILLHIHRFDTYAVGEGDGNFAKAGVYIYHSSTQTFNYLGFECESSYRYVESLFPMSRRLNFIDRAS